MRHPGIVAALAVLISGFVGATQAGEIELNLQAVLARTGGTDTVSALVYLSDRVDLTTLEDEIQRGDGTRGQRHEVVVTALLERAVDLQRLPGFDYGALGGADLLRGELAGATPQMPPRLSECSGVPAGCSATARTGGN